MSEVAISEAKSKDCHSHITNDTVRVGIVGLGRSGWAIHALTLAGMPEQFAVVAVTDQSEERRQEAVAKFGCRAHENLESLLADNEVDLVVLATPSRFHYEQALQAFSANKNVICEKPLSSTSDEATQMMKAAKAAGKVLTGFQQNRYMPSFVKLREVIASGKLGRIVQIRICIHGFGRRWDWQTLKEFSGGELNNSGAHFIDQGLQFFGSTEPEIFCHLDRTLTSGDAEDHVKVVLRAEGAPVVDVEITKSCAFPQNMWHVMGTEGGLTGTQKELTWKYVDFSKLPARPVDRQPTPDRSYNSEQYDWTEEKWTLPPDQPVQYIPFYQDLYKTLKKGTPLVVTPESIQRQIAVLEKCRKLCPWI
ncbi:MAG: Gfo/Idh/MocA family oxidoreductase [Chthoniobacterales bacterium]